VTAATSYAYAGKVGQLFGSGNMKLSTTRNAVLIASRQLFALAFEKAASEL
jgi:hypothetical protein